MALQETHDELMHRVWPAEAIWGTPEAEALRMCWSCWLAQRFTPYNGGLSRAAQRRHCGGHNPAEECACTHPQGQDKGRPVQVAPATQ